MSINMSAQLSEFETAANALREMNERYTENYSAVFDSLRQIDASWDGVDNDTFNEKFVSLEKDFIEMTTFIERTISHLILSSQAYDTVGKAGSRRAERLNRCDFKEANTRNSPTAGFGGGKGGGGGGGGSW